MRFLAGFAIILSMMLPTLVQAQEAATDLTIKFRAVKNLQTGEIELQEVGNISTADFNADFAGLGMKVSDLYSDSGDQQSFVAIDKDGKIKNVFAPPPNDMAKAAIIDNLSEGDQIVMAKFWWPVQSSLPTVDEVKEITRASMAVALEMICEADPKPETMSLNVELGVSLGVNGRFEFSSEWRPSRDCK